MGVSLEEIIHRTRREYNGSLVSGEDLMSIDVSDSVKVNESR
jgi:hypothetical protein